MERVTVTELKARLSHYLREVRAGRSFTVVSRDIPVATLGPHEEDALGGLETIPADPSAEPLDAPVLGRPCELPDAAELIRQDRDERDDRMSALALEALEAARARRADGDAG